MPSQIADREGIHDIDASSLNQPTLALIERENESTQRERRKGLSDSLPINFRFGSNDSGRTILSHDIDTCVSYHLFHCFSA